MSGSIFQISFDYSYALADIVESMNGANSLDLTFQTPEMFPDFKFGWLMSESEIIPDFVIINSELFGGNDKVTKVIKSIAPEIAYYPILIQRDAYQLFSNIPLLEGCINIKKSKVKRFSNGDIMKISSPVFFPNDYPPLFRVEEMSSYFCSLTFKEVVENNYLRGLTFENCSIKSKSWF